MGSRSQHYEKLREFSQINEQFNISFKLVDSQHDLTENEKVHALLEYIARDIIIVPQYFQSVLDTFQVEVPRLLLQAITFTNAFPFNHPKHIVNCILLSKVIKARTDLKSYALKYFENYPSPFEEDSKTPLKAKRSRFMLDDIVSVRDLDIVEATYFLLRSDPKFYRQKWKWSVFFKKYSLHSDYEVVWLSCQITGIVLGLNEPSLKSLIAQRLPEEINIKLTIEFDKNSGFIRQPQDTQSLDFHPTIPLKNRELSDVVINVSGIYIPTLNGPKREFLIDVPSTSNNLRKIAIGLSSGKAICLQGPVGSGKTGLVEHLAGCTGRLLGETFIKLQLGDQTDSKMLLGTYRCTDNPGEFVWQPGVLTQAVIQGNWLLLEDIDLASMDIASVLSSLLENKALTIPGYRDLVPVTPGFQLFLTQRLISTTRTGYYKRQSNAMKLLDKQLLQVTVDPLSSPELEEILHIKYPQFKTVANRFIKVFELFSEKESDEPQKTRGRLVSTRDFLKWCSRAAIDFDVKGQESALKVLQDAIDVFCCSLPNIAEALSLAKDISTHLGIVNHKADYYFNSYKPLLKLTSDSLLAGRVSLEREHSIYSKQGKFCFTRPAAVLLERIMCCVKLKEPVLLVGETGTGKTSAVQYLAHTLGKKLIVINMNQQSDSADLLGGFKPVDLKTIIAPIRREFEAVFKDFFDTELNKEFLSKVAFAFNKEKYVQLLSFMRKSTGAALRRLHALLENPSDRGKELKDRQFLERWRIVDEKLKKVEAHLKQANALYFAFIEGSLVKAVQEGSWVLLDEINLANAETLECLSGLLEDSSGSLCLLERGDKKPVQRHPNFTLFACMNPATNVGKKDLPVGLRNRFTEFYVDELTEKSDLMLLVGSYLDAMSLKDRDVSKIVDFYIGIRKEMQSSLCDGLGHKPHFSLRSLCRALLVAAKNPCGTFKRSVYEAFCLSFLTQLDPGSYQVVQNMIARYLVGEAKQLKAVLKQPIPEPKERGSTFLEFEGYWIKKGALEPNTPDDYILTNSVRRNLKDIARVVSIGKLPVLLQGDTSVGKTSLITFLARSSGNKCVRINNHEHTDLQEYIGSYVADPSGKLVFREGVLVEAMRQGHWIILDELNLAPTEVLEALNRVLDDNRELFIPETQKVVKADPNFMLFATQNPPGAYGGRKMLSRAFRNRFVELHFNEIPPAELEFILHKRCAMPESYAKKMISIMSDLQVRRRGSAAFAGKHGFITLRDLFRWGERYRLALHDPSNYYDWNQHLADEGYLVLAGKVRKDDEKKQIVDVLQKHWQRPVSLENLFSLHEKTSTVTKHILEKLENNSARHPNIVWTFNMRKLAVLVGKALEFKEPVLLVGETGGGKTTVCQLIAENNGQQLVAVNCHMHTESSDFIGGLRPVRDRSENNQSLFEWVDGPLLQAMMKGSVFLADEISLADDSVLERLNSLLEPERTLLLAEKGIDLNNPNNSETIVAHPDFVFIGTMNPGGDFGKKELSPALRNRFTEIWCESCTERDDLILIVDRNIRDGNFGEKIMNFIDWFRNTDIGKRFTISIRDILTWANFINTCSSKMPVDDAYANGAHLVFLDSLGSGVTSTESTLSLNTFKKRCQTFLNEQIGGITPNTEANSNKLTYKESHIGIDPFFIPLGQEATSQDAFSFEAPTTITNTLNLLRGMQLNKAILLEGSPGVGKTSLVTALAKLSGNKIFRVNLSDQTDISDLFGADLPVEGGTGGQFSWRDGPLLQALKEGSWILLDELNLASQSVLEGLNACLDHRGEIFIPELGKTFHVKTGTRFFACQNPMKQGGSRRGLPKSFLNRFIQVYVSPFSAEDMLVILSDQFRGLPPGMIEKMIEFNCKLADGLDRHLFGHKGAPWECNLRDLTRWCQATIDNLKNSSLSPESTAQLIYVDRMRSATDKAKVEEIFREVFEAPLRGTKPVAYVDAENVYFGDVSLRRGQDQPNDHVLNEDEGHLVLRGHLGALRSLTYCVNQNWMAILVGSSGVGKSSVLKTLAHLAGKTLKTLPVTAAMDTTDILGGFEQTNYSRHLEEIAKEAERQTLATVQNLLMDEKVNKAAQLLEYWEEYLAISESTTQTLAEEVHLFSRRITKLEELLKELYMKCNSVDEGNKLLLSLNKCSKIFESVNGDKSLSAGGRFEWVDSILVKCLQEGSWLLVDNVNLCSAAVLDRLNALLEPNGVLTISEKGVDENGKMCEVRPHKDFRIFLTMDPKNGEISRAMRNRGVEIYMLNETETTPHSNHFDVKSLIHSQGLDSPELIGALLKIHDFISNLILSEKPGNQDMLQCSSLISRQIQHGISVADAFYNTCVEVYCKTRHSSEFSCNNVLEVVREGIGSCLMESSHNKFCSNATLNTKDLVRWSNLETVKYHAAMYEEAVAKFTLDNSKLRIDDCEAEYVHKINRNDTSKTAKDFTMWSDLEIVRLQNEFFGQANFFTLANLLVINYTLSSANDIDYRTSYLKNIMINPNQAEWKLALDRFTRVTKFFENKHHSLPYDTRWINGENSDNNITSNAINYALQVEIHKLQDKLEEKYSAKNSLYHYVIALTKKEVSEAFDSAVCSNYIKLRSEHFIFMRQLFMSYAKSADVATTFVKVLELSSWRQALHGFLTGVRLPNQGVTSGKWLESKRDSLAVYYRWFYKYSIDAIAKLLGAKIPQPLQQIVSTINDSIEELFSANHKIAKNYKKLNSVPGFLTSEWQLLSLDLLQSYDFYHSRNNAERILAFFKHTPQYRNLLVQLKCFIYSNTEAKDCFSLLKTFDDVAAEQLRLSPQETEILPLVDALTQTILLQAIKSIHSGCSFELNNGLTNNILVPVEFDGALLKYRETGDKKLLHEIRKFFFSVATKSSSACPNVSGVGSVWFNTITQLLIRLDGECTTLSNFRAVENQRRYLGLLLWNNMHALAEQRFDFVSTQMGILENNIASFVIRLQEALKVVVVDFKDFSCDCILDLTLNKVVRRIYAKYIGISCAIPRDNNSTLSNIADIHMNLSYAEIYLNSILPRVDPIAKKAMKKNHIASVISMFEQMKTSFDLQNELLSNEAECNHPYYSAIKEIIVELNGKINKKYVGENIATTNVDFNKCYSYSYVVQQIEHATNNVIKPSILDDVEICTQLLKDPKNSNNKDKIKSYIDKFASQMPSLENIFQNWSLFRGSYPDIVEPLLANVAQYLYGFKLKLFWIKREFLKFHQFDVDLETELLRLVALPSFNVDYYNVERTQSLINVLLNTEQTQHMKGKEVVRALKCGIQECFNQCVINGKNSREVDTALVTKFNDLVSSFVDTWNREEHRKEREKAEAESLYKIRTKCNDKPEDEQIQDELKELFPNYHVVDFSDLQEKPPSGSSSSSEQNGNAGTAELVTEEDLSFVVDLHSKLFKNFISTEWLAPDFTKHVHADFVSPLMEKYKLARRIMENHPHYFSYDLDSELCGSLAVLLEVSRRYGATNELVGENSPRITSKKSKDFYRESDVEEVKTCYHVLEGLKSKINELLKEWPDQPTLNTILTVIDRILNFDIQSPISRYLTGFDILLAKCYEWEQVAHSGVSLINDTPELIGQIITWRKLELSRWKDLLNTTFAEMTKPLAKWWLYMYNLSKQFITDKQVTDTELVDTLQKFLMNSSIVDFHGRLEMILEFHCYAVILPKSTESQLFVSILWNIYNYFNQFSNAVTNKIKDIRSPIERKLKDYVKIVKWKDVSYWSVKDTVDKSHKTLHKFIREFKEALMQPVTPYLTTITPDNPIESVGIWDRPQRQNPKAYHYTLDADSYVVRASVKDAPYLSKARKICKETILGTDYPNLVKSLDSFVGDIIETSSHLKKLEVDTTLPKEKQKSQAKTILQQKHRALADLFQHLSKIGVSYKTGIVESKLKKATDEFTVEPIDLSVSFACLGLNRTDEKILTIWDSCELYYYRCLMRYDVLMTALNTPAQDLGVQNIERCRGFAAHLLVLCQEQKKALIAASKSLYTLRGYSKQLHEACENSTFITTKQLTEIKNILNSTTAVVSQLQLILNSCPDDSTSTATLNDFIEIPLLEPNSTKLKNKGDENWKLATNSINKVTSLITRILQSVQKCETRLPQTDREKLRLTFVPFPNHDQIFEYLREIVTALDCLKTIFEPTKIVDPINRLSSAITDVTRIDPSAPTTPSSPHDDERFTKPLLIIFQNLYKKYRDIIPNNNNPEEAINLQENHLKTLLMTNISLDITLLDLSNVTDIAEETVKNLLGGSAYASEETRSATAQCLPLFDQVLLLSQYFITQQVAAYRTSCKITSVLINIFIDLATKGFCIPPELSDEMDKEGMSKPSDGLGLGEGQGERDVSDKIESEDQLDDAQPAGQEKEETEDPDCKEAENGIEMSEDFDSKLQDKKADEDKEDEEPSDNSDAEEQMGETEKGADQLDQEIWGDDNEDKDETEQNDEEEGKGGEKEGEDRLDAKDENDSKEKSTANNKEQNEDSEKNKKEINELNEPEEYDDQQTDPYHGNQPELPEPEPMDLPDDLQLDDGKDGDQQQQEEENPFDIDEMKDQQTPDDKPEDAAHQTEENQQNDEENEFSSDDEDVTKKNEDGDNEEEENAEEQPMKSQAVAEEDFEEPNDKDDVALDETPSGQENVEAMDVDDAYGTDKTQATQSENLKSDQPITETQQEDKPDKDGVGQSQMEQCESGHSVQGTTPEEPKSSNKEEEKDEERKAERPGESDSKRSLGDVTQPVEKKLKTMNATDKEEDFESAEPEKPSADVHRHIKEAKEEKTTQVLDAATQEQAEAQKITQSEDAAEDENVEEPIPETKSEEMEVDDSTTTIKEKSVKSDKSDETLTNSKQHLEGDITDELKDVDVEGDIVPTSTVPRGAESSHHTQYHLLHDTTSENLTQEEINAVRSQVEHELSTLKAAPTSLEAEQTWQKISSVTSTLAQDLSEKLRLVLEPTQASHLKGDFRTGRRINMRKVIPYIASQFRKDKIWLRRTKPSKREYRIVLAIDDSSSMADNRSKELAFESVALISKALSLLESGQLAVVSFGETTEVHHKLSEPFTETSGVRLLRNFHFEQKQTNVGKLVDFVTEMFDQSDVRSSVPNAKLLLIVSDGRGVFSQGKNHVSQAVRRAKLANVFIVFVIIDNPENKASILDIRTTVFKEGRLVGMQSYMDEFPFSFYIILRDINCLPGVLSDALMQWFEIVTAQQ